MGDESYIPSYDYGVKDITEYYAEAETDGVNGGIKEQKMMFDGQFKRSQSNLTSGILYAQQETYHGIQNKEREDNVLRYLRIESKLINDKQVVNYNIDALKSKTLSELEALGVLVKFSDGSLARVDANGDVSAKFRVGSSIITINTAKTTSPAYRTVSGKMLKALTSLAKDIGSDVLTDRIAIKNGQEPVDMIDVVVGDKLVTPKVVDNNKPSVLTEQRLSDIFNNKEAQLLMPDQMISTLVSDPTSIVNLLSKMNVKQENSDAIQFIHPLLHFYGKRARGGSFGAFSTDNYEAQKLLTTTFEYEKYRQSLQKKSVQMPFSFEQMSRTGSVELFHAFKVLNKTVKFQQQNMMVPETPGSDVMVEKNFKTLNDLVEHLDGYNRMDDAVWGEIALILQKTPVNMYSFVGLITVPSNQKTGHKKMNKYSNVFNRVGSDEKIHTYHTANEYNFESLTKAHAYDVTDGSTIALLSQLVSAVAFGGATQQETLDLQNSMAAVMDINREILSKQFIKEAEAIYEKTKDPALLKIIDRFTSGNFTIQGFTLSQKDIYKDILRGGLEHLLDTVKNGNIDSSLIKEMIDNVDLSLDTPATRSRIGTSLRASLFKSTNKIKMSGFIGAVTVMHKLIMSFELPGGKKTSREGFIVGAFKHGLEGVHGEIVNVTPENVSNVVRGTTPFDYVEVTYNDGSSELRRRGRTFSIQKDGSVNTDGSPALQMVINPSIDATSIASIRAVFTPDVTKSPVIDTVEKLATDVKENDLVSIDGKPGIFYWYAVETMGEEAIHKAVTDGKFNIDLTEEFNLKWYVYTREDGKDIRSTELYRDVYRKTLKKVSREEFALARGKLIAEFNRLNDAGKKMWTVKNSEVVVPAFMKKAYQLGDGVALYHIIGLDSSPKTNAKAYFKENYKVRGFAEETQGKFRSGLIAKYTLLSLSEDHGYYARILDTLNSYTTQKVTQ